MEPQDFDKDFWQPVCPSCKKKSPGIYTGCSHWVCRSCLDHYCAICHSLLPNVVHEHETTCLPVYEKYTTLAKEIQDSGWKDLLKNSLFLKQFGAIQKQIEAFRRNPPEKAIQAPKTQPNNPRAVRRANQNHARDERTLRRAERLGSLVAPSIREKEKARNIREAPRRPGPKLGRRTTRRKRLSRPPKRRSQSRTRHDIHESEPESAEKHMVDEYGNLRLIRAKRPKRFVDDSGNVFYHPG